MNLNPTEHMMVILSTGQVLGFLVVLLIISLIWLIDKPCTKLVKAFRDWLIEEAKEEESTGPEPKSTQL